MSLNFSFQVIDSTMTVIDKTLRIFGDKSVDDAETADGDNPADKEFTASLHSFLNKLMEAYKFYNTSSQLYERTTYKKVTTYDKIIKSLIGGNPLSNQSSTREVKS